MLWFLLILLFLLLAIAVYVPLLLLMAVVVTIATIHYFVTLDWGNKNERANGLISLVGLVIIIGIVLALMHLWSQSTTRQTTRHTPTISEKSGVTPTIAKVIVQRANLRSKPGRSDSPDNKPLMELEMGERLELLSPNHNGNGWYHVRHSGTGTEGWVHGNSIEFESVLS